MRRARRLVFAVAAAALIAPLTVPASASGATARRYGEIISAYQYRSGIVSVWGYAFDREQLWPSPWFCLWVGGHCVKPVRPNLPSPVRNAIHHVHSPHRFHAYVRVPPGDFVTLRSDNGGPPVYLDSAWVSRPGSRIVALARKYVGARYTYGGASPRTGFDCSGYVMYVYRAAGVASLPHYTVAQTHAPYMRRIYWSDARPGDLIFYYSGNYPFHVAIYAGHGYQYAAATPAQGVRYQRIWSRNIEFRTDWH